MLTPWRQHQRLVRLRALQERVAQESLSSAHLRMSNSEALIERVMSGIMTSHLRQFKFLEDGDVINAAFCAQTCRGLTETLVYCKTNLELTKKEYAERLRVYLAAKVERSKADRIEEASELRWKDHLRRQEQSSQDDAFLSNRSRMEQKPGVTRASTTVFEKH